MSPTMSGTQSENWDEVRIHWQRLEREGALSPEEIFDDPAKQRIAHSIAKEAVRSPEQVVRLKLRRQTEAYYSLQAADAQEQAQRAHSPADRAVWTRIAGKWLELLSRVRTSSS